MKVHLPSVLDKWGSIGQYSTVDIVRYGAPLEEREAPAVRGVSVPSLDRARRGQQDLLLPT